MSRINNIGTYNTVSALWDKHPEGGIEGDYATIGATIYEWDKYQDKWATDTSSSDTTSTEPQESSQNISTEQSGNSDTPITNQEINFLGQFDTISDVWEKFPEGGHEGDYVTIGDSKHKYWWNKYTSLWDDTTESGNKDNGEKGNDVTIEGQELNDLGTFASIDNLWDKYPEGGHEGDYVMIGVTKYYWNKYTRQWTDNPITTKTDLPTSVVNPDDTPANPEFINDKGTFTSLDDAWQKYPAGGNTGDYITIGDSRYWWNSYINQWQKEGTSIQSATSKQYVLDGNTEIEGTAKTDEDMNVGRNLNVNGTSNIHGNENISGDQAIKGSQSIEEDSKINGDLTVDGTIHNKNIDDKLDDLKVYEESTRKIIGQNINDGLANGTVKQANYADEAGQADEADGLTKIGLDKTDSRYLRKDVPDTASGMISFLQGIQIGNNFETGTSGCVIRIDADGKTYAEVDKLYVRLKAVFDTLEIRKFQGSTGNRIVSNATAIVTRIEVVKDVNGNISGYRCFFKGTDGDKTISNDFIIGDFAFCKESNAKGIHYYWRKITDINVSPNTNNELSIVLSASDCDTDSDVPQVQDNIIQLGSLDTTRQGAIIEYTSGEDSPSYKIYQNINSYSLADKDVLGLGYNSGSNKAYMNVYGDAYIGDKNGGDFIKYDPETKKVTIKGELLVTANQTLTQLLDQYSTSDAMEKAISKAQTSAEKNANDYSDKALGSAQKALLEKISDLGKSLGNYSYLLDALKQDTSVEGGLLQTSLLSLGYTDSEGARHTMAGTNGIPTAGSEGQSIAAWYGGEMIDRQQYDATKTSHYNDKATIDDNAARTLFRMDGSGYTAKGNLTWDERGILTIKQVTWGNEDIKNFFNAFSVGLLNDKLQITPRGDFTTLTVSGEKVLTLNTLMEDTTYWGATMISGKVTGDINIGGKLYIGYDTTNDAVVFYKSADGGKTKEAANVYSLGGLSAFGANTNISSGGSDTSYDRLDKWSDYTTDKATNVLSALLGNDLNTRVEALEGGSAASLSVTGSGNAITDISKAGTAITATKGATFLTAHQSLAHTHTLNIGNTAKSVGLNGTQSWSLGEIGAAAVGHTHTFSELLSKPTTISGYGITDMLLHYGNGLASQDLNTIWTEGALYYAAGSNSITNKPSGIDAFGMLSLRSAGGWYSHLLISSDQGSGIYYNHNNATTWIRVWDNSNLTKISQLSNDSNFITSSASISGNAATSTKFAAAQVISLTGDITGSASSQAGWNIGTTIGTGKVTNAMLAGAIDNSKLAHSTITIAGITIALGGSIAAGSFLVDAGGSYTGKLYDLVPKQMFSGYNNTDAPVSGWNSGIVLGDNWNASHFQRYLLLSGNRLYVGNNANPINWNTVAYLTDNVATSTVASKLGTVTVGNANNPIYLNLGVPTACSHTFGNYNGEVPVSNGTVNSNLNADMLDGWHLGSIINQVGNTDFSDFPNGYIIASGTNATNSPYNIVGGNQATILQVIPGNNSYGAQLAIGFGNARLAYRTHANSSTWTSWTNIIAGNADQAVKLQTARTLWGQLFDGTGNVDGCINVNSKTSDTNYNQNIRLHPGNGWTTLMFCGPENTGTAGTSASSWSLHTNNGQFMLGHNSTNNVMLIDTNNNIGIGTTLPTYKLDVNGTLHATGATTLGGTVDIAGLTHIGGTLELYNLLTFNLAEGHFGTSYGYTDPWHGLSASFKFGGSVAMVAAYVNGLVHAAGPVILDSALNVKGVSAFGNYISMGSNRINFGTLNSTGWGYAFYADNSGMNIDCTSEATKMLGIYADTVTVNGNFLSTGGVTAYTSSDRRLKKNIRLADSLKVIRTLGGTFAFDYRKDNRHSIGFIAQNVRNSELSDMVRESDGYLRINYLDTRLISLALGASVELDDELIRLKRKVASLEKEVELLKKAS